MEEDNNFSFTVDQGGVNDVTFTVDENGDLHTDVRQKKTEDNKRETKPDDYEVKEDGI